MVGTCAGSARGWTKKRPSLLQRTARPRLAGSAGALDSTEKRGGMLFVSQRETSAHPESIRPQSPPAPSRRALALRQPAAALLPAPLAAPPTSAEHAARALPVGVPPDDHPVQARRPGCMGRRGRERRHVSARSSGTRARGTRTADGKQSEGTLEAGGVRPGQDEGEAVRVERVRVEREDAGRRVARWVERRRAVVVCDGDQSRRREAHWQAGATEGSAEGRKERSAERDGQTHAGWTGASC